MKASDLTLFGLAAVGIAVAVALSKRRSTSISTDTSWLHYSSFPAYQPTVDTTEIIVPDPEYVLR